MIQSITIDGFKSILSMKLDLGRVNCFIGANGVGKSNILEAIGVLGAAANGKVDDEALLRRGVRPGVPQLYRTSFRSDKTPEYIELSALGRKQEEYRISILNPLKRPKPAWEFKEEYLSDGVDGEDPIVSDRVRNKKNLNPIAGLAALRMVDIGEDSPAFKLMQCLQSYSIYSPNTPTLRAMVIDTQPRDPLGLAGGGLAESFAELRKVMLNKNEDLLDSIFDLIDWVADIETTQSARSLLSPSVVRSQEVLKFTDRYMQKNRNTLTAHDVSEGALYVLFCAILCLSSKSPKLFAIDNLDQALNPRLATRLVQKLGNWLKEGDKERQLLFTAHNPAVLDGLDLQDDEIRLFAVERNSAGHTMIHRVQLTEKTAELKKEYPLSRLWLMGHLGALPNV
jgi:predicted ATPase